MTFCRISRTNRRLRHDVGYHKLLIKKVNSILFHSTCNKLVWESFIAL